jgi:hypothetical protein
VVSVAARIPQTVKQGGWLVLTIKSMVVLGHCYVRLMQPRVQSKEPGTCFYSRAALPGYVLWMLCVEWLVAGGLIFLSQS